MEEWWLRSLIESTSTPNTETSLLSEGARELLDYLYSFPHPPGYRSFLESYIVDFDSSEGDPGLVRALGSRLGLWIEIGRAETPDDIFIDKLTRVIGNFGPLVHEESPTILGDIPSIPYIVDMSREEFHRWVVATGDVGDILYSDRLYLLSEIVASRT
jgi:hypothetical protein